jgi:nitrate reductase beta subunit
MSSDGGPGMYESDPFATTDGEPVPVSAETFHLTQQRKSGSTRPSVNLLDWDGSEVSPGMFPGARQQ